MSLGHSAMLHIPPELSDYILDFLHDDRKALKACSLTCRGWYSTSRYHLYHKVDLHSSKGCRTFLQILKDASYVGHFARELRLCNFAPRDQFPDEPCELASVGAFIFPALPHIERLDVSFMTIDHVLATQFTQNFARTTTLTLQYCRFSSFADLTSVLASFPLLRKCTLRGVSWDPSHGALDHATKRGYQCPRWGALTLGRDLNLDMLVPWLIQDTDSNTLHSLTASVASEADAMVLCDLITAFASSLEHLDLDWHFKSFADVRLPFGFTLKDCSSLRHLTLRCAIALQSTVSWVTSLLADLCPDKLERLTLEIRLLGDAEGLDWVRLQTILLGPKFKNLQTVEIKMVQWRTVDASSVDVDIFVRSRLPQLDARDMLRLVC